MKMFAFKKRAFFSAVAFLLGMSSASALTPSFSVDFFKPAVDDSDFWSLYSSNTPKKHSYNFGGFIHYAHHPYEVGDANFNRVQGLVNNFLTGDFLGSYTPLRGFTVGARLPVYFLNAVRAPLLGRNENNIGLGDIELDAKIRLLNRDKYSVGVSVIPFITLPTATSPVENFSGNGNVTGGVRLAVDGKPHKRVTLGLNVGYEARQATLDIGQNKIDDHLLLGGGVAVDILPKKLRLIGEVQTETVVSDFFNRRTTPVEARLGFRYTFKERLDVNLGAGFGLTNGIASPQFRVLAGVSYAQRNIDDASLKDPNDAYLKDPKNRNPNDAYLKDRNPGDVNLEDELTLGEKIYFDFDRATIRPISKPLLDKLAGFIKAHKEIKKLRIEGHTCDLGADAYNRTLSQKRAEAVVDYLVQQGVNRAVFHPIGYGESKPQVRNVDEASREHNRRVQIFVEEKNN